MIAWLHHLFNPHCAECRVDSECKNCEVLRGLLEAERFEKQKLLNAVIELTKPDVRIEEEKKFDTESLKPKFVPWRVKQAALESEDRHAALLLRQKKDEMASTRTSTVSQSERENIDELEKELDIIRQEEKKNA